MLMKRIRALKDKQGTLNQDSDTKTKRPWSEQREKKKRDKQEEKDVEESKKTIFNIVVKV